MNEFLLFLTGVLSTLFVYIAWRTGAEERLCYTTIAVFLILIASVGGKLVELLGHETNVGNIYYAALFLATYFIIERFGKRGGVRTLVIGAVIAVFFSALVQIAILYEGAESSAPLNAALTTVFASSLRVAFASLIAFLVSQSVNIFLYIYMKERAHGRYLWLRANATNLFAQIVDSTIFFLIAFWGVVAPENMFDILLTGIAIKVVYMMLAAPLLYLNKEEREIGKDYAAITLR
ncbi:VUT family protein [Candidatus Parcubacteria bacterium]|nr:MAG: VUT family protein [Candidatus Parcubacteria bacterium]